MKYCILIFNICLLSACALRSVGPCAYDLKASGWSTTNPEKTLQDEYNKKAKWYTNSRGDFLVCQIVRKGRYCSGLYSFFDKKEDASYERSDIICVE